MLQLRSSALRDTFSRIRFQESIVHLDVLPSWRCVLRGFGMPKRVRVYQHAARRSACYFRDVYPLAAGRCPRNQLLWRCTRVFARPKHCKFDMRGIETVPSTEARPAAEHLETACRWRPARQIAIHTSTAPAPNNAVRQLCLIHSAGARYQLVLGTRGELHIHRYKLRQCASGGNNSVPLCRVCGHLWVSVHIR